jgi:hypothetical protein
MPFACVVGGAALLLWPAVVNAYPLVFIDTVSYLLHALTWRHPWDKTAAYGPFLLLASGRISLWGAAAAQAMLVSWLLWRVVAVVAGAPDRWRHGALVLALAVATAAPWFVALAMPDIFAAVVVLCLFLLAWDDGASPRLRLALGALGAFAIAVHLSHLGIAGAAVVLAVLMRRRLAPALRTAAPLVAAVAFLLAANLAAFHKPALSAHGALFLLARLQADGPAAATLKRHCPERGWVLCAHADMLPMSADAFLWSADSPILRARDGTPRPDNGLSLTGEAAEIVATTFAEMKLATAQAMVMNALRQAARAKLGDTLEPSDLRGGVAEVVGELLGARERARFAASAQMRDTDAGSAADPFHQAAFWAALSALAVWFAMGRWRTRPAQAAFALFALCAIAANAFMTGALSGPHDRYGARIAWMAVAAAVLAWAGPRRGVAAAAG